MIRNMIATDLDQCGEILCSVYNDEFWQCRWNLDTAAAYLNDYFDASKFVGYIIEIIDDFGFIAFYYYLKVSP